MSKSDKNKPELTPKERIAYLESLMLVEQSAPGVDNSPVFVKYLDDEDAPVRVMAIKGLWFSPTVVLMDRLIGMAQNDPSLEVRIQAISGLGIYIHEGVMADYDYDFGPMSEILREEDLPEASYQRVKEFLLGVYPDEARSLDERRFAIESLGFEWDPEVADLIEQAYNRPECEMKISALFAMGRSGLARWQEILGWELYNKDKDIQREAIRAVGEIGVDELGKDLWRLTYDEDHGIMLEAIDALGQTGWEGGFERLEELTGHFDPEIAQVAEHALEEWLFMDELQRQADESDMEDLDDMLD